MNKLLENLNEKQKEAVLQTEGPVMAIAGAGSGKTSVLTTRIAYLIYEKNVHYNNILAITFTNKAANEMKERVHKLTNINTSYMWISTFHAMCSRILREHIERLGYKKGFQIIDDDDVKQLIKSILKKLNFDTKVYKAKDIKRMVLKAKQSSAYLKGIENPYQNVVKRVLKEYQNNLKSNNLVDFEDLLLLTIQLLKQEDDIREFYQKKFEYILVDEFQDTNNVQYELVQLLVNENKNLFIVGDEDQSIYAFRGANIENIMKFKRDYSKHHLVLLEQNYRSTNTILQAANQIIQNNSTRIEKKLFSTKGDGETITHFKAVTARDEVEFVAMKVLELVRKGYTYNDFAILYRANSTSRMFEEIFMQKQIPYRIYGNTSFFKRKEIKDFTAYLRLILNHDDSFSFMRVVTTPRRGIGQVTIEKLLTFSVEYDLDLFEAIEQADQILSTRMVNKLKKFKKMIIDFKEKLNDYPLNEYVDYILEHSGYLTMLEKDDKKDVRYENLLELKTILTENTALYQDISKEEMLVFLLEDIALKSEEKQSEIEDGVTMLTLHAAKGLEFRVVFIVTLENGMFPLHRSFSDKFAFEEERRLMYVGVTRAQEKLFLTNAQIRQTYGETMRNQDSVFLQEISDDLIETKGYYKYANQPRESKKKKKSQVIRQKKRNNLDQYKKNDLNKGDNVYHSTFGEGMVVSVTDDMCVIAFKHPHGVKKLLKDHKALSKH